MTLQDLYIGKKVYLISKEGKMHITEIVSIDNGGTILVDLRNYNNNKVSFKFDYNKVVYRFSHNNEDYLYISYNESDAAILKRKIVIEQLEKLKTSLDDAFKMVQRHRKMNWDILNTNDINKWIDEFKKNNQW